MKINSKTKTFCLFIATPSLLPNRLLLAALFVLESMLQLPVQNVVLTGGLSGRVTDQSGAVVQGASVVVSNLATGVNQLAHTKRAGLYQFPALMPGTYPIRTSLKGFRDIQTLVQALVGNTTSQDIKFQVGSSADTVKVIGTPRLLGLNPRPPVLENSSCHGFDQRVRIQIPSHRKAGPPQPLRRRVLCGTSAVVDCRVTPCAESDQVPLRIVPGLATILLVMNFEI
jgi:hypothetical protein